jgi:hypothetical protein
LKNDCSPSLDGLQNGDETGLPDQHAVAESRAEDDVHIAEASGAEAGMTGFANDGENVEEATEVDGKIGDVALVLEAQECASEESVAKIGDEAVELEAQKCVAEEACEAQGVERMQVEPTMGDAAEDEQEDKQARAEEEKTRLDLEEVYNKQEAEEQAEKNNEVMADIANKEVNDEPEAEGMAVATTAEKVATDTEGLVLEATEDADKAVQDQDTVGMPKISLDDLSDIDENEMEDTGYLSESPVEDPVDILAGFDHIHGFGSGDAPVCHEAEQD